MLVRTDPLYLVATRVDAEWNSPELECKVPKLVEDTRNLRMHADHDQGCSKKCHDLLLTLMESVRISWRYAAILQYKLTHTMYS